MSSQHSLVCHRHGRSFLDHLDSEDAEHEAEDVRQQQESQAVAAAAAGARRAAEQSIHLQRRHVADAIAQPSTSESLPVAAVSSDASQMLVNSQQQQTPLQLRHRDNHEDPAHAQSNAPSSTRTGLGQSDTRNGPEGTSHSHLHPQDDSTDTSASAAEDASADSAAAAHMITAAGPAVAPTAPSQDGLSSSLPPDHDESSAQASVPSAIPSASAASATAAAAAAEDAAASSASVDSAELDDDLTESELSWVDSDMVYLATDEEGHPFNCHIPADPESGRPELQCLLLFEVSTSQAAYTVFAPLSLLWTCELVAVRPSLPLSVLLRLCAVDLPWVKVYSWRCNTLHLGDHEKEQMKAYIKMRYNQTFIIDQIVSSVQQLPAIEFDPSA